MAKNSKTHHPAAFINALAESGTKEGAIEYLQDTWNSFITLQNALFGLGFTKQQVNLMIRTGTLGKVF